MKRTTSMETSNGVSEHRGRSRGRRTGIFVSGLFSVALLASMAPVPAQAAVSSVSGGAFGWKVAVSLFGGPTNVRGTDAADAVVELPSSGSTTPMVDFAASGTGQYGPAKIYQSGPAAVSTHGDKGDALHAGLVASSATVANVGTWVGVMTEDTTGVYQPALGGEMDPFIAATVSSNCNTKENGTATASTTILAGRLVDTDANGDPTNERQVAVNPAPNTVETGVLAHVGDSWRVTFNEQIVTNGGKTIEVNAVHLELLGPIAVGNMWIGQSRCGVA